MKTVLAVIGLLLGVITVKLCTSTDATVRAQGPTLSLVQAAGPIGEVILNPASGNITYCSPHAQLSEFAPVANPNGGCAVIGAIPTTSLLNNGFVSVLPTILNIDSMANAGYWYANPYPPASMVNAVKPYAPAIAETLTRTTGVAWVGNLATGLVVQCTYTYYTASGAPAGQCVQAASPIQ
jgi:hypothetical protein